VGRFPRGITKTRRRFGDAAGGGLLAK